MCARSRKGRRGNQTDKQREREKEEEGFSVVVVVDKIWRGRRDANFESKSFLPKKRGDKLGAISPHTALQRNIYEKVAAFKFGKSFFCDQRALAIGKARDGGGAVTEKKGREKKRCINHVRTFRPLLSTSSGLRWCTW